MLRAWTERPLADLLEVHGLDGVAETPFPNDGWSGATLTRLVRPSDHHACILKRTSWATDWIARSTRDHALREGFVASLPMPLCQPLVAPYFGAAADGTSVAILMPDLTGALLAWERSDGQPSVTIDDLDQVIGGLARLHAMPWPIADAKDAAVIWPSAPLRERLLLLSPRSGARLAADGVSAGERFVGGWAAFDRHASRAASDLIQALDQDPGPLLAALHSLPHTVIHGDMKLANVALLDRARVALIDWQMTAIAPVAVELGWMLVSNSGSLSEGPEAVVERYASAIRTAAASSVGDLVAYEPSNRFPDHVLDAAIGSGSQARLRSVERTVGDWATQLDLTWIVGLLLRGWRKGLDAEAGLVLASGASAAQDLAWWCDRAVEGAGRRLQ